LAQNQSVPPEVKTAIADSVKASNSPTADDKKGGYHEEGGIWGTTTSNGTVVVPAKPGPYSGPNDKTAHIDPGNSANPSLKDNLQSVDGTWHVHPRGGSDKTFVQPPSGVDKQNAVAPINIVVGAENKRVYFYNSTGVVREMSLKDFMKDSQ
jgi:hypothetical protein